MGMNDILWKYNALTITTRLSQSDRKKVRNTEPRFEVLSSQRVRGSIETS